MPVPAMRHMTKADLARQHIQEMVVSGAVRAGDRLTSREVSEALGMSETPIREAMRSLAAEGWLDFNPHLGVVIASLKQEQLLEVYAVRGALEGLAIELGGPTYSTELLDELDRSLEELEVAVTALDLASYAQLNRKFHTLLSDTPATQWTLRVLSNLWAQNSAMHRGFEAVPTTRIRQSLDEHWAIRNAIRAGDFARASALTIEHERNAGAELIASLSARSGSSR
jgi:DNA-binding GntR family transcriptional regulator